MGSNPIDTFNPLDSTIQMKTTDASTAESDRELFILPTVQVYGVLSYVDPDGLIEYGRNSFCLVRNYDYYSDDDTLFMFETDREGYYIELESTFFSNTIGKKIFIPVIINR